MLLSMRTEKRRTALTFICIAVCLFPLWNTVLAQDACPDPFEVMKNKKVASINIPGTDIIHGYLEHLPDSYNAFPTKKFPLVIYIHGVVETGDGSSTGLCNLLFQWGWWPSVEVEEDKFPHTVLDQNGQ